MVAGTVLKLLGVTFEKKYGFSENVRILKKKYAAKAWSLRNLKFVGTPRKDLVAVYRTYLRPILEYATEAFSSSLTEAIERWQRMSLKVILETK